MSIRLPPNPGRFLVSRTTASDRLFHVPAGHPVVGTTTGCRQDRLQRRHEGREPDQATRGNGLGKRHDGEIRCVPPSQIDDEASITLIDISRLELQRS